MDFVGFELEFWIDDIIIGDFNVVGVIWYLGKY